MRTGSIFSLFLSLAWLATNAAAQSGTREKELIEASSGSGVWYWMIFIVVAGLGGAYFLWRRSQKVIEQPKDDNQYHKYYGGDDSELEQVDAAQELEWLRKAKKKPSGAKYGPKRAQAREPRPAKKAKIADLSLDTKMFQEKMKMLQYAQLPINSFGELTPAKKFEPLPDSNDRALLTAIEQANEEFEEDEAIRELAVRILAAFRTRNSVDTLGQMALYDLSSNLRSKSVSILTDFDHESVFESILLACADPTREVRAAAARGLFRLNFDRADAWKRLGESGDAYRMSHAIRAAVEAGIVQKSLDRLVHEDLKIAYEAFTLVALMIKAGEDKEIFDAIRDHRDERVKFALLHVIKVVRSERSIDGLLKLKENTSLSPEVITRINEAINSYQRVAV